MLIQEQSTGLDLNNNFSVASLHAMTECTLMNLSLCLFFCDHSVEGKQKPYRTVILHQLFKYSLSMQITAVLENISPFILSLLY